MVLYTILPILAIGFQKYPAGARKITRLGNFVHFIWVNSSISFRHFRLFCFDFFVLGITEGATVQFSTPAAPAQALRRQLPREPSQALRRQLPREPSQALRRQLPQRGSDRLELLDPNAPPVGELPPQRVRGRRGGGAQAAGNQPKPSPMGKVSAASGLNRSDRLVRGRRMRSCLRRV